MEGLCGWLLRWQGSLRTADSLQCVEALGRLAAPPGAARQALLASLQTHVPDMQEPRAALHLLLAAGRLDSGGSDRSPPAAAARHLEGAIEGALGPQPTKAQLLCLAAGLSGVGCRPSAGLDARWRRACAEPWSPTELGELKQALRLMGLWGTGGGSKTLVEATENVLLANFEGVVAVGGLSAFLRLFAAWDHAPAPQTEACLEGALLDSLSQMEARGVAQVFLSCARLKVPLEPETLRAVATAACSRAGELRPRDLARLLEGFSALTWYPGDACVAALSARALETLSEFSPQNLSTCIRALGRFRRRQGPAGDLIVAMAGRLHDWRAAGGMPTSEIVALLKSFGGMGRHPGDAVAESWMNAALEQKDILSPRHLSGLLWALARLQHAPRGDARVLVETFLRTACSSMSPHELSSSVWACGKIGLDLSPETLAVVTEEALAAVPQFSRVNVLNLLRGLAVMECEVSTPLMNACSSRLSASNDCAMRTRELSSVLWSYAMIQHQPPTELLQAAEAASHTYCKPADVSALVWAHARLGRALPEHALNAYAEQFLANAPLAGSSRSFPKLLCTLIWSFGCLKQTPHGTVWAKLVHQVRVLAQVGELSLTGISQVLWAYSVLQVDSAESAMLLALGEERFHVSTASTGQNGGKGRGGRRQHQRDLSSIFLTCVRQQGAVPQGLVQALEDSVVHLPRSSSAADLTLPEANELLWGYDKVGLSPAPAVLGTLESSVLAAGDELDASQVSTFMYFCASFEHVPQAALLNMMEKKLQRGAESLPGEALPLLTMAYRKFESLRKGTPAAASNLRKSRAGGGASAVIERAAGGRAKRGKLIPLALFDADSLE